MKNAFDLRVSINQILSLVLANGDRKTYIVEGPMGTGKSSIVKLAKEHCGEDAYHYITVDCTQWDVGDVQVPAVDKERRVVEQLPNVLLVGDGTKPVFINLDEIGKCSRPVQNALLPVMLERRVGARSLPEGSIVMGATNLGAEGVGDLFQAHACDRVSFLPMRHPNGKEWIAWGLANDVHPAVLAWADEEPRLFQSFEDVENPADNPYIFHPKERRRAFVTPRSLYLASLELDEKRRCEVGDDHATLCAIAGNIGVRGALDLMSYVNMADKLPSWQAVLNDPAGAPLPDAKTPTAAVMLAQRAVQRVTLDDLSDVLVYIQRLPQEVQAMFASQVLRQKGKSAWVAQNRDFGGWVAKNHWAMK